MLTLPRQALVNEYRDRIEKLQNAVDKVIQVEAEQAQLNRDYGILKGQHQKLTERLESARLSYSADTRSNSARFRIIDPPRVPPQPSGPPREFFSTLVTLLGLGLGVALAFLMSQVRPTYDDRQTLNEMTDLPVLGSVSMIWTTEQIKKHQRRHVAFLSGLLALASAYALMMGTFLFDQSLAGYLADIKRIAGV